MAINRYNFQRIAANWIVKNNPDAVRSVLVSNSLVAGMSTANNLTNNQLATLLYNYYMVNGKDAFADLMRQITPNENLNDSEIALLRNSTNELRAIVPMVSMQPVMNTGITTQSSESVVSDVKQWWDLIIGTGQTTIAPTVTTQTKSSPVTIALIIGGIAVLGIIAWFVMKYKS